jgi:hypothetical protein
LIDTEAPLDVLHETTAYRIRTATQLLELRRKRKCSQ